MQPALCEGIMRPSLRGPGGTIRPSLLILFAAGCSDLTGLNPITDGEDPTPVSVRIDPDEPCSSDTLRVEVQGAVPEAFQWTLDGRPTSIETDHVPAEQTRRYQQWGVLVDVDGLSSPLRDAVTIRSCPASVLSVELEPSMPFVVDPIEAQVHAEDPDGDAIVLTYTFFVDEDEVQQSSDPVLPAGTAVKHQSVEVEVQASSGGQLGEPARSAPVVVQNSPPEAPVASIVPSIPFSVHDLRCEPSVLSADADGDDVAYVASWSVDGDAFTETLTTEWPGDTVPSSATAAGQEWICTLTPSDGDDEGPAAYATATIRSGLFPCDGRNMGDDYRDMVSMGGPDHRYGMRHVASADMSIGRIEVFTGERSGTNAVSMYSHDALDNAPDVELGRGTWPMATENSWQGAELDECVPLEAGEVYWVVWEPINGAQATRAPGGDPVTYRGSHDDGLSWSGPWSNTEKYKLFCCE
ncbi:MAG: hypothetical protein EA397_15790 [Deltaproteobacteria bacterium]|nr:MAG: hypothetical protein EA397_15790 [Deltaproteobacteria bacterium]